MYNKAVHVFMLWAAQGTTIARICTACPAEHEWLEDNDNLRLLQQIGAHALHD
jgi:hypothetical protein